VTNFENQKVEMQENERNKELTALWFNSIQSDNKIISTR
jgi:hypothetical protein